MTTPEGLHKKFEIRRTSNGELVEEFTFTLIPEHDPDADVALIVYADAVRSKNPQLADGILAALDEAKGNRAAGRLARGEIEREQR